MTTPVICIGSVLWDVIGRAECDMPLGADRPGRISKLPGGVAMNIAMTLKELGLASVLLSVVGRDADGQALLDEVAAKGIEGSHMLRRADLPTDRYMAVESPDGLIAAIADAHSLEAAGDAILTPLCDGTLGSATAPWQGVIALDGNLTEALLAQIAMMPELAQADLRVAPASPGKALRLMALRDHPGATYYLNLEEANLLAGTSFSASGDAAQALRDQGMARVVVTNGAAPATDARAEGLLSDLPPPVTVRRVTGAGDSFMAAHIAAETQGATATDALARALAQAAAHISKDPS